jgi:hypothetical protein
MPGRGEASRTGAEPLTGALPRPSFSSKLKAFP